MKHLDIPIPEWVLRRWIRVKLNDANTLVVAGVEVDGTPTSILRKVELVDRGESFSKEPFTFQLKEAEFKVHIRLHFMGNFKEPPHDLELDLSAKKEVKLRLEFRLDQPEWDVFEEE